MVCERCGDVFYVSSYTYVCADFGRSSLKIPTGGFGVTYKEGFQNKIVLLQLFSCVFKTLTSRIDVSGSFACGAGLKVFSLHVLYEDFPCS